MEEIMGEDTENAPAAGASEPLYTQEEAEILRATLAENDIGQFTAEAIEAHQAEEKKRATNEKEEEKRRAKMIKETAATAKEVEKLTDKQAKETTKYIKEQEGVRKEAEKEAKNQADARVKTVLLTKIRKYLQRFPQVSPFIPKSVDKLQTPELEETVKIIRSELSSSNNISQMWSFAGMGGEFLEGVVGDGSWMTRIPVASRPNLTGLAATFQSQETLGKLMPIFAEIDIEYPNLFGSNIWLRATMVITKIIFDQNVKNKYPDVVVAHKMKGMNNVTLTAAELAATQ